MTAFAKNSSAIYFKLLQSLLDGKITDHAVVLLGGNAYA